MALRHDIGDAILGFISTVRCNTRQTMESSLLSSFAGNEIFYKPAHGGFKVTAVLWMAREQLCDTTLVLLVILFYRLQNRASSAILTWIFLLSCRRRVEPF